ncbi:DDX58-like protein [Mya arenaria]|uniref:DDX58-like protein n=1 Tax=Mya arenaria TaxID=6604 RepID=A0ABY7F8S6_MYAAR|nr:DDX58-like protein [Mya arenaria]
MEELSQEENNFHRIQLLTETCLLRALRQLLRQGPRIVTSDGRSYLLPFSKFIADNDVKRCLNEYFNLRRGSPLGQGHTFDLPNENTMTNIDGLDLENVLVMVCIYIKKDAEPKDILKRCTEIYNELNQKQKLSNVDFNAMFVRLKYLSLEISDYLQDQELKQNMSALIPRCKKQSIATDLPFANIFENKLNIDEINTIVGKYCTTFDKIGISKTLSTDSGVGTEIQSGPEAYNTDMPSPHNEDPKKKNDGESILTSHISCESGFSEDTPEQEPEVAIMGVTKINGEDEPKAKKRRIDITNDKLPAPNVSPESSSVDGEIITLTATTDYELGDIEQNTPTSDIHQHADIMKDCSGHDNNTNKSPASVPMKGESGPLQAKKRRIDITPDKLPLSNVSPGMSNSVDEEIIALYATTDYELNERGHIEHNTSTSDIHQQANVVEGCVGHDTHTNMSTASEPFKGHMSPLLIFHCSADEALARSIAAGLEDSFGFVPTVMALTTMQAYGVHNFRNLKDTFTILGRGMLIVTNDTSEEFQDYARRFVKELPPDLSETITLVLQTVTKEDFGIDETFTGKLLEFKHKNDVNIPKISLALNDAISVRGYQKELAEKACDGHNVIIMAPTNAGKTQVACKIVEMHFQNFNTRTPRVLFLVENEALALQQGQVCEKLLRWKRTKVFTGNTQRSKSQYIWDYLDKRDIFVVTAQILVNALKAGKIESLQEFSLIVFDECHHSKKQHMYNELMSKYLDLKIKCDLSGSDLPQIVGLTASLGVGGKTLAVYGLKYMKQIVANMDAKFLCTIRSEASKTELRKYVSSPKEALIGVESRANDVFKKALEDIAQNISEYINTDQTVMGASIEDKERLQDCNIPLTFGTDAYQQWSSEFVQTIAKIDSDDIRRVLEPCSKYLEVYNKALLVYNDARLTEAMAILSEFIDDVREGEQGQKIANTL